MTCHRNFGLKPMGKSHLHLVSTAPGRTPGNEQDQAAARAADLRHRVWIIFWLSMLCWLGCGYLFLWVFGVIE